MWSTTASREEPDPGGSTTAAPPGAGANQPDDAERQDDGTEPTLARRHVLQDIGGSGGRVYRWGMSSLPRLVITAVVVQKRPVAEVAATYNVHRSWVYKLLARYREEGEAALNPRSRRPKTSPRALEEGTVRAFLSWRTQLITNGHDAGPATIAHHLAQDGITVSEATIWRALHRHGLITPEPKKRPKSSYIRFQAAAGSCPLPPQVAQSAHTRCPSVVTSWLT